MQTVLSRLSAVPGVVGGLVCDGAGAVLAHSFPPVFDAATLDDVARTLADGAEALGLAGDGDDLLDLRFRDARVLARPVAGGLLALVCGAAADAHLVMPSLGAAAAALARSGLPLPEPPPAAPPAPPAATAPPGRASHVPAPTRGLAALRRRLAGPPPAPGPARKR